MIPSALEARKRSKEWRKNTEIKKLDELIKEACDKGYTYIVVDVLCESTKEYLKNLGYSIHYKEIDMKGYANGYEGLKYPVDIISW